MHPIVLKWTVRTNIFDAFNQSSTCGDQCGKTTNKIIKHPKSKSFKF